MARSTGRLRLLASLVILASALCCEVPLRAHALSTSCAAYWAGTWECYAPSQLKLAENQMPVQPLDPGAAIRKETGLVLNYIVVTEGPGFVPTRGAREKPDGIDYVFGSLDLSRGIDCRPRYAAYWVMADEVLGRSKALRGAQMSLVCNDLSTVWWLSTSLPGRDLTLGIFSNLPASTVLRIANSIVASSKPS